MTRRTVLQRNCFFERERKIEQSLAAAQHPALGLYWDTMTDDLEEAVVGASYLHLVDDFGSSSWGRRWVEEGRDIDDGDFCCHVKMCLYCCGQYVNQYHQYSKVLMLVPPTIGLRLLSTSVGR